MLKMAELKSDPKKIQGILRSQKDGSVYTTKPISVFVPKRWLDTPLCTIEDRIHIVSICMFKSGKDYAIFNIAAIIELGVSEYKTTDIDGVECIEFMYESGEVVIKDLAVAIDNTLPYYITDIIVKKGSIVPYLSYEEFTRIPETFPLYSRLAIPPYPYANIYMSYVCRDAKDKRKKAESGKPYTNIPLSNIALSVENTLNKFSGGYLNDGIQSATMNKTDKASMSEIIMRS